MNTIIGIIIGMVVWSTFVLIVGAITDFENETANTFLCGVWGILFFILLKPACHIIQTVWRHRFYKRYQRYALIENGNYTGLAYFIDKDIISNFETDENKPFHLKQYQKQKYYGMPYKDEIITKENFGKRLKEKSTYDWFNKWLKG